jgi:mono/diheme cytochrome c family protein
MQRGRIHPDGWARAADQAFVTILLCAFAAGASLAAASNDVEQGESLYRARCAECHGLEGKGDGAKAPFLSPRPGNLVSAATSAKSDQELLKIIANGKPRTSMPSWNGTLSSEEQRAVLNYIRSLVRFTRPLTPPPPAP